LNGQVFFQDLCGSIADFSAIINNKIRLKFTQRWINFEIPGD